MAPVSFSGRACRSALVAWTAWIEANTPRTVRGPLLRERGIPYEALTPADKAYLVDLQSGTCAACGRTGVPLRVDYDHPSGYVRGMVCATCAFVVAALDDPDRARGMARYLRYCGVWPR